MKNYFVDVRKTKVINVNGVALPLMELNGRNILCKDAKNFYPFNYANKKQALAKVAKLEGAGIKADMVYPSLQSMGFKINVHSGE